MPAIRGHTFLMGTNVGRLRRRRLLPALVVLCLGCAFAFPLTASAAPTYVSGASLAGATQEGDVLTASPGTWTSTGSSVAYAYAWFHDDGTAVGTGSTRTVTGGDIGHQIYVEISATDGTGTSSVKTGPVGPMRYQPPVNTGSPAVSGALQEGSTLVASPGTWAVQGSAAGPIHVEYQWYRTCTVNPDGTPDCSPAIGSGDSLALSTTDVGREISVSVIASYPDGAGGVATNQVNIDNLGPVAAAAAPPAPVGGPPAAPPAPAPAPPAAPAPVVQPPPPPAPDASAAATQDAVVVAPPLRLTLTSLTTSTKSAHAGSRFGAVAHVVRNDTGTRLSAGRVSWRATVRGRTVPQTSAGWQKGATTSVWKIPRWAAGRTMRVTVVVTFQGVTVQKVFRVAVTRT